MSVNRIFSPLKKKTIRQYIDVMTSSATQRYRDIFRATLWVFFVNALLATLKIVSGLMFHSLGILGDGLDSLGDVLATGVLLIAAHWLQKPPDKDHPWGHDRADTLASKFINFFMFFMGTQLLIKAVESLLNQKDNVPPSPLGIVVLSINIVIKVLLAFYQRRTGKNENSLMLTTNAENMANDVMISFSVMVGVGLSFFLQNSAIDAAMAGIVGIWIIAHSIHGFNKTNLELMDGLKQPELYQKVFDAVESVEGAYNPHRVRIRRFADRYLIDLDVEMEGKMRLEEAHRLGCSIESAIKKALPQVYDIMLHLEPRNNSEEGERYGLSRREI